MPIFYCDSEFPNGFCKCAGCANNVFTADGRRELQEEWEHTQWVAHENHVREMAKNFPSLRLVEWFFGQDFRVSSELLAIPFLQWTIDRSSAPEPLRLKRTLQNWRPTHPLSTLDPWTLTRGMPSITLAESKPETRRILEADKEAVVYPEVYMPVNEFVR